MNRLKIKFKPHNIALAIVVTLISNIWLQSAGSQAIRDQSKTPATIFGEAEVKFNKNSSKANLQCQNLFVELYSDRQPLTNRDAQKLPPAQAEQIQKLPLFSYGTNLKGDLSTGKCNYQVSVDVKYIGKKANLKFSQFVTFNGKSVDATSPVVVVTVPSQPTRLDTKITFNN